MNDNVLDRGIELVSQALKAVTDHYEKNGKTTLSFNVAGNYDKDGILLIIEIKDMISGQNVAQIHTGIGYKTKEKLYSNGMKLITIMARAINEAGLASKPAVPIN